MVSVLWAKSGDGPGYGCSAHAVLVKPFEQYFIDGDSVMLVGLADINDHLLCRASFHQRVLLPPPGGSAGRQVRLVGITSIRAPSVIAEMAGSTWSIFSSRSIASTTIGRLVESTTIFVVWITLSLP